MTKIKKPWTKPEVRKIDLSPAERERLFPGSADRAREYDKKGE